MACLIVVTLEGVAQNTIGLPSIINYTKNDFKAGTQTWDIAQGANGLMYFANNEGLITYDGNYWKPYPLPNRTIMRSIAIGRKGQIYAGGQGEIGYFAPDAQGFLKYVSLTTLLPAQERNFADIWDIEIVDEAVFFRASDRKIFELKNNTFSIYDPISEWLFLKNINGELYAQDRTEGLLKFKSTLWSPVANAKLIGNDAITGIIKGKNNDLKVFTYQGLQYQLRNDSLFKSRNYSSYTSGSNVFKASAVSRDEIVLATSSQGCLIIDQQGKLIQKISRKEGLQNNNVLSVYIDKGGNLWTGLNNGISVIAYNSAIKYITPNKDNEVSGFTSHIFNNKLYIGSSEGAYMVSLNANMQDLSFVKGDFTPVRNSYGQVWRINEVNQELLMGHTRGCFYLKENTAIPVSKDPGWLFVPLSQVIPSKNIIAGTYMGLKMFEYTNKGFKDLGNLKGIFESLRFLAIDNKNRIWASHPYRGVYMLTLNKDGKSYESKLFTEKDGLPSTFDNHVFKISNRIIFATCKGPYEFDDNSNRFIHSEFLTPILGKTEIRYMNEDSEGNIWFCSGKKLGVININRGKEKTDRHIIFFPELTGQILSGFENIYPYNKQNIFIASEKGVIHLNFEKYKSIKSKPNIILSLVKAIGKNDSSIYSGSTLQSVVFTKNKETKINLPSHYQSFHFEYSTPVYGIEKNIEYSYMLQGYDKAWSIWSNKTEKDYTNLSNGNYIFKVKSRDNLGNESDYILYSFRIAPPWYKSNWAYIAYVLLMLVIFYGLSKWQRQKLNLQRLKYEESQRQMNILHQLELEKNEKEIIKLKNEKLENEIQLKTRELADTSMHLVERSEALLKVKEELQKLYKNTNENHDIKKTLHLLHDIEKNNDNWEKFASHFDEVNNNFLKKMKLKFPGLTNNDLKLCTYLQLNLSSKEIAQLMNITLRGVEINRYRLRKKLNITSKQSLNAFLNEHAE